MSRHSTKYIEEARFSIALIKWLGIGGFIVLPFSFTDGVADWRYLTISAIAGLVWCGALVYAWRYESMLASGFAFLTMIGAFHGSETFYAAEPPFWHSLQWLAVFLAVASFPKIVFRPRLLRICQLLEPDAQLAGTSNGGQHPS